MILYPFGIIDATLEAGVDPPGREEGGGRRGEGEGEALQPKFSFSFDI